MTTIILPDDIADRFHCPDELAVVELASILAEEYGLCLTNDGSGNIVTMPIGDET